MGRLVALFLEVASNEEVEELIGSSDFYVGSNHNGIPSLKDGVADFVDAEGLLCLEAVFEVFALEHL